MIVIYISDNQRIIRIDQNGSRLLSIVFCTTINTNRTFYK